MKSYKVILVLTALNAALVIGAGAGIAGSEAGGAAQTTPEVVRAQGFDLVNADGTVVAQLYAGDDGTGQVRLRDATGTVRVKLGAADDGSGLILFQGGDPVPGVTASSDDRGSRVILAERDGQKRLLRP